MGNSFLHSRLLHHALLARKLLRSSLNLLKHCAFVFPSTSEAIRSHRSSTSLPNFFMAATNSSCCFSDHSPLWGDAAGSGSGVAGRAGLSPLPFMPLAAAVPLTAAAGLPLGVAAVAARLTSTSVNTSSRAVASELISVLLRLPASWNEVSDLGAPAPPRRPCLAMSMTSASVRVRTAAATCAHRLAVPTGNLMSAFSSSRFSSAVQAAMRALRLAASCFRAAAAWAMRAS
mmetsp:Transcript_17038/g.50861  ORF Transcript_17038/g.50861 Transcript_17038/m.50861 type:complete len:231 (-) Transcript_17038:1348-2040(-)